MKKTQKKFDLSDNLYYADQIGSVEEQIEWLDKLSISHCQLITHCEDYQEVFVALVHIIEGNRISARLLQLLPSPKESIKGFHHKSVVNILDWLRLHDFIRDSETICFSNPLNNHPVCEEEVSDGEEATVPVVD